MQLEPGTRVRCHDAGKNKRIKEGCEYIVVSDNGYYVYLEVVGYYRTFRFKPIYRVKMGRA